jgi:dTDP-4-dehydrorhamnose 3,5-epimerase
MNIEKTDFRNLIVIKNSLFTDDRGSFQESYSEARFRVGTGLNVSFVQDNESVSKINVLRGLHLQIPPKGQSKLVRVSRGRAIDVVVDLRKSEPTFGRHFKIELSAENGQQLFIPEGFAHGFITLEDHTIFSYKCSNYYSKEHERSIRWNDPALNIDWGCLDPLVSERDADALLLNEFESPFF